MNKYVLNNQFDALDKRILKELSVNARMAFSQLATILNVSNSLIHQRIKKLEESNVIKRAVYQYDPELIGYDTTAYTQIMIVHAQYISSITEALKDIPEITECINIAGRYAILVKIHAVNNTHLRDIIYEKIQPIKGIESTSTTFAFETAFRRPVAIEL